MRVHLINREGQTEDASVVDIKALVGVTVLFRDGKTYVFHGMELPDTAVYVESVVENFTAITMQPFPTEPPPPPKDGFYWFKSERASYRSIAQHINGCWFLHDEAGPRSMETLNKRGWYLDGPVEATPPQVKMAFRAGWNATTEHLGGVSGYSEEQEELHFDEAWQKFVGDDDES
jgi:hypothetical protein